jgi:hypothetical protein
VPTPTLFEVINTPKTLMKNSGALPPAARIGEKSTHEQSQLVDSFQELIFFLPIKVAPATSSLILS